MAQATTTTEEPNMTGVTVTDMTVTVDLSMIHRVSIYNGKKFLGDLWLNTWRIQLDLVDQSIDLKTFLCGDDKHYTIVFKVEDE